MFKDSDEYGPNSVTPAPRFFPGTVLNVIAGHISIKFKLSGPNITVSEGVNSGYKSLLYAYDLLQIGEVERVIVCDVNIFSPIQYRKAVEIFLPQFEHVSTIVLEKAKTEKEESNTVPFDIHLSTPPKPRYREIEPLYIIPHILLNSYHILKEQNKSTTYLSTNTDQGLNGLELN